MDIKYKNKNIEKLCTNKKSSKKKFGEIVCEKLFAAINILQAADSLDDIYNIPSYRLHPLKGNRDGQFAIDLGRKLGWRLIIIPLDISNKYSKIKIIEIWEVSNHYE